MGRKKMNRKTYQITLDVLSRECLEYLASKEGKSMSHMIGDCIIDYMGYYEGKLDDIRRSIAERDIDDEDD